MFTRCVFTIHFESSKQLSCSTESFIDAEDFECDITLLEIYLDVISFLLNLKYCNNFYR